jgi:hypothetical protein
MVQGHAPLDKAFAKSIFDKVIPAFQEQGFGCGLEPAASAVTGQRSANNRKSDFLVNQGLVARIAEAGRLCVDVVHAAALTHAADIGVTLTLARRHPARGAS